MNMQQAAVDIKRAHVVFAGIEGRKETYTWFLRSLREYRHQKKDLVFVCFVC